VIGERIATTPLNSLGSALCVIIDIERGEVTKAAVDS
jgi:hypothetical protein